MKEEFDFRSIRTLAFLMPLMFFSMGMKCGLLYLAIEEREAMPMVSLFRLTTGFSLAFYFLESIFVIGLFVNLYRMGEETSWWNAAGIMAMVHLLAELAARILEWQFSFAGDSAAKFMFYILIDTVPGAFLIFLTSFFLHGVKKLTGRMRGNDRNNRRIERWKRLWNAGAGLLILYGPVFRICVRLIDPAPIILLKWGGLAVVAVFFAVSVPVTREIWSFCQEYYLFRYNRN